MNIGKKIQFIFIIHVLLTHQDQDRMT